MNADRRNRSRPLALAVAMPLVLVSPPVAAQGRFALELLGGGAWNAPSSLSIEQHGERRLERTVDWQTRPFEQPIYWALRASLAVAGGGWELQLLHHKLYAGDLPSEVERFEVTHGFNLVTVARAFELGRGCAVRAGGGFVLAHPESAVRGRYGQASGNLGGGYQLTGPALLGGLGWRRGLTSHLFLAAEAQLTVARAQVPVAGGTATLVDTAVHGLVGLGVRFGGSRPRG